MGIISEIHFGKQKKLTEAQREKLVEHFSKGYYIILTGHSSYLSTWLVSLASLLKLQKWSKYGHALMNCDYIDSTEEKDKFKFMEATSSGAHYSSFDEVMDCDHVCLLSPKNMTNEEWTEVIDRLVKFNGIPYDDLFDLVDHTHMSCVEVVLEAFEDIKVFPELNKKIKEEGNNLLPQMFRDSTDFEIILEI